METVTKTVTQVKTVNKCKNNRIDCPNHPNYPVIVDRYQEVVTVPELVYVGKEGVENAAKGAAGRLDDDVAGMVARKESPLDIWKYAEVDYVRDNSWEKTAGYYSSWKNAGNRAADKQIGNSVAGKEGSFASASGRSAKVDQIVEVMKRGKISDDGYRIITDLDDRTRVIFGLDVGDRAHKLNIGGYTNPVDHMNIEIQVKKTCQRVRTEWDLHLILDKNRQVINQIITGDRARRK